MSRLAPPPLHRQPPPDTLCSPAFRVAFPVLAALSLALLLVIAGRPPIELALAPALLLVACWLGGRRAGTVAVALFVVALPIALPAAALAGAWVR